MAPNRAIDSFEWTGIPSKVIFGAGKIDILPDVLSSMNLRRCIILTTPNQRHLGERLAALIGAKASAKFNQATMHTPLHITEQALQVATEAQVDSTVSIGGGSTTGLGKALAIRLGIPQICIPTTYAGSEMTPTLGETVNGRKTTRRDEAIRPKVVIYDVNLTLKLPVRTSLTSGINAIAHAGELSVVPVEAYESVLTNPNRSRKSVLQRNQPLDPTLRSGRHPAPFPRTAGDQANPRVAVRSDCSPVRRVAVRHVPREHEDGTASQNVPRDWWRAQSLSCRDSHCNFAASARLQCPCRSGRSAGHWRGFAVWRWRCG
jgi:hypothetical protein